MLTLSYYLLGDYLLIHYYSHEFFEFIPFYKHWFYKIEMVTIYCWKFNKMLLEKKICMIFWFLFRMFFKKFE